MNTKTKKTRTVNGKIKIKKIKIINGNKVQINEN